MTRTAFAQSAQIKARFGRAVSPSTVTRWAQDGKIVIVGRQVDVNASLVLLDQLGVGRLRRDVAERHRAENAQKSPAEALDAAPSPPVASSSETRSRAHYKAQALHYENRSLRLAMDLRKGARYLLDDVKTEAHGLGGLVRAALERVIDQTAPRLAALRSDLDRRRLLERELQRLRRTLKSEFPRALRRMRQAPKVRL